jgi:hypothetical protein
MVLARIIIDDRVGEVVAFLRQSAGNRDDDSLYGMPGIDGSWFRCAGNQQWPSQLDFFDYGHAETLFAELLRAGGCLGFILSARRPSRSGEAPRWHRLGCQPTRTNSTAQRT